MTREVKSAFVLRSIVMHQHEMSRIVRNMDFELSVVSGSTLHADSNGENRFQISSKMKKLW